MLLPFDKKYLQDCLKPERDVMGWVSSWKLLTVGINLKGFCLPLSRSPYNYLPWNTHADTAAPDACSARHRADSSLIPVTRQTRAPEDACAWSFRKNVSTSRDFLAPPLFLLSPLPPVYWNISLRSGNKSVIKEWQMIFFYPFKGKPG